MLLKTDNICFYSQCGTGTVFMGMVLSTEVKSPMLEVEATARTGTETFLILTVTIATAIALRVSVTITTAEIHQESGKRGATPLICLYDGTIAAFPIVVSNTNVEVTFSKTCFYSFYSSTSTLFLTLFFIKEFI